MPKCTLFVLVSEGAASKNGSPLLIRGVLRRASRLGGDSGAGCGVVANVDADPPPQILTAPLTHDVGLAPEGTQIGATFLRVLGCTEDHLLGALR
jgi:hypothetical protein